MTKEDVILKIKSLQEEIAQASPVQKLLLESYELTPMFTLLGRIIYAEGVNDLTLESK